MNLFDLLIEDRDDCDCTVETFDSYESVRAIVLDGPKPRMLGPLWDGSATVDGPRCLTVPLRREPVTHADLKKAFAMAALLAPTVPLEGRDLLPAARLVPTNWAGPPCDYPTVAVEGVPHPVFVSDPGFLGQWIHNRSYHGLVIFLHGLARCA